ncbi:MAG TPA: histidine kinase [Chitinophagaceae bacterium]
MAKHNCRIGFNDGLLMAIGIPLLSLVIPIVFFGCRFNRPPQLGWDKYITTLILTTAIWLGNRYVMIHSRRKYPLFKDVRRRLFYQSFIMFVFTVTSDTILSQLADSIYSKDRGPMTTMDVLIQSNAAALFCTIMIIGIYESIFFMHQLRHYVEETEKLKRESLNAELNALKTQVNPHFLFNNLNTLSSVIPEDPKLAVNFVNQLSKLYRHILEVKDEQSILLKDELDVLKAYAFLLQTRFGGNLDVSINVPDEKLNKKIVPLSLQLLMENAIKHNIVSSDKPLKIDVTAVNGKLVVSNNLQLKNQVNESTGIGLDNIRNRYKLLGDGNVEVTANESSFTVSIPLIEN